MPKNPVECAIEAIGGVRKMARTLKVEPGTVSKWKGKGLIPSRHHKALLEAARSLRKRLTANDLVMGRDQ
jgi:hypothetical protein